MSNQARQASRKYDVVFEDLRGRPDDDAGPAAEFDAGGGDDEFFADVGSPIDKLDAGGGASGDDEVSVVFGDDDEPTNSTDSADDNDQVAALRRELDEMRAAQNQRAAQEQVAGHVAQIDGQLREVDAGLSDVEQKLAAQREAFERAAEDGDSKAQLKASEEIAALRYRAESLKDAKAHLAAQREQVPRAAGQAVNAHPETTRWLAKNAWFNRPEYAAEAAAARAIDLALKQQGLDPTTPDFYRKMDAELRKKFRSLPSSEGSQDQGRRTQRPPTAPVRGNGSPAPQAGRPGQIVLTRQDRETMDSLGLDWRDKSVVSEYARNKAATFKRGQ